MNSLCTINLSPYEYNHISQAEVSRKFANYRRRNILRIHYVQQEITDNPIP